MCIRDRFYIIQNNEIRIISDMQSSYIQIIKTYRIKTSNLQNIKNTKAISQCFLDVYKRQYMSYNWMCIFQF